MSEHTIHLPTISVVVPSYNQGQFLRDALESIFRQNYPELEVIVIDGGSSDESVSIIREYESRLKFWRSHPDDGQTAAINEGMTHCSGEIVAWLNSDDFYWDDALWTVARAYIQHPDFGLYIGNGLRFNQEEDKYTPFAPLHVTLNRSSLINGLDYILQPSTFFLRSAWEAVDGLRDHLNYTMDWDIIIRIAVQYPAILINEFLGVSREYDETKTSTGKFRRAYEIIQLTQEHGATDVTAGAVFYLFETLLNAETGDIDIQDVRSQVWQSMLSIFNHLKTHYGGLHGFPEVGDPQDVYYIPNGRYGTLTDRSPHNYNDLPSISIVIPSFNQAHFIERTLESIVSQNYPLLEVWIMDGGSTDNTPEVVKPFLTHNIHWVSQPDRGPAHAINRGFQRSTGELLTWIASDDVLAVGALWRVAEAFIQEPDTELVYANALYIDEDDHLFLAHHGTHRTGLYYGKMEARELIPAYWKYVHAVPQPTVYFRRTLYEHYGGVDEAYKFIFDFELFFRYASANVKKIEHTTALYRIHTQSKTGGDWSNFLIELYRFSRPLWPRLFAPEFRSTFRSFLTAFMNRRMGNHPRNLRFWAIACAVGLSVIFRIGNPESFGVKRRKKQMQATIEAEKKASVTLDLPLNRQFTAHFCSFTYPLSPGYSGGEIRDFHILKHLVTISDVNFWAIYGVKPDEKRANVLEPYITQLHVPDRHLMTRIADKVKKSTNHNFPYSQEIYFHDLRAQLLQSRLQRKLEREKPDFLFISPQTNPIALKLNKDTLETRFIMASYDVEAVRIERLIQLRQQRGDEANENELELTTKFEADNLKLYDGIIAVSELDKQIFVERYNFPPKRILVIENGVDTAHFAFAPRQNKHDANIIFTGTMNYLPNRQAAFRLIERIMPLIWNEYPQAKLWLVGQFPDAELKAKHDGKRIFVTGRVDDIRTYLSKANVTCIPLEAGSGTKYKILEAMSSGLPIVCSPLAAEGLNVTHNKHALIYESDTDIAHTLVRVLKEPETTLSMVDNGRTLVENLYSWDANLPKLDEWLTALREMPVRSQTSVKE